jgi:predicted component of viral defense system (DUF524 family)
MIELVTLKTKIEQLNKKQQIEVLKIIMKLDVAFSENNNGIFFNLSGLGEQQLTQINSYINYVSDQEEALQEFENVKNELSETFFNNENKSVKDTVVTVSSTGNP